MSPKDLLLKVDRARESLITRARRRKPFANLADFLCLQPQWLASSEEKLLSSKCVEKNFYAFVWNLLLRTNPAIISAAACSSRQQSSWILRPETRRVGFGSWRWILISSGDGSIENELRVRRRFLRLWSPLSMLNGRALAFLTLPAFRRRETFNPNKVSRVRGFRKLHVDSRRVGYTFCALISCKRGLVCRCFHSDASFEVIYAVQSVRDELCSCSSSSPIEIAFSSESFRVEQNSFMSL